ncbi:MAG: UDP-N-acetylglucosamine 1-carboxyvinyltransferase [Candidatus Campbellbacteria bacterium]|nr:UDP-N-acetylglucosamine 1-carboxyvinyltransferase [Candidatus Campbellbacteria bacterium]
MTGTANLTHIGSLIRNLRKERDLTQSDLARKLSTTQSVVARIENGEQNLSAEMLSKISKALDRDIVVVSKGALNIQVEGGRKLKGKIETRTSKNATVALMSAALLNNSTTTLKNIPKIEEVYRLAEVLESLGASVKWHENDLSITPPENFNLDNLNTESAAKTRSIIMFIAPFLHRFKKFTLPEPGGCKLGARTVRPHFYALENFGVKFQETDNSYRISHRGLKPSEIVLYESGDTVTENAIMTAAKIPGETIIKYASANYQVQDLCFFLESLGVKIEGIGSTTLKVNGLEEIDIPVTYHVSEDPIESMFFLSSAIVTKSSIIIERCPIDFLEVELLKLEKMGFKYKIVNRYKAKNGKTDLVDIKTFPSSLKALPDKLHSLPYPGLNPDNLPFFTVIATQAEGQTLIHDWMYEKRAVYYKDLDKLGADTVLMDQHRLYITGPSKLRGAEVICPPALRPGAVILIGMLAASGVSTLRNIYSINRGYEDIILRLNNLGAKIKVLREF